METENIVQGKDGEILTLCEHLFTPVHIFHVFTLAVFPTISCQSRAGHKSMKVLKNLIQYFNHCNHYRDVMIRWHFPKTGKLVNPSRINGGFDIVPKYVSVLQDLCELHLRSNLNNQISNGCLLKTLFFFVFLLSS